jgi:tRNA (adenine57-N1/adenine58-N1)-methyltransferase catalytic subunit
MTQNGPLREGEAVILIDRKEREYLKRLDRARKISIRGGAFDIDDLIGREEGSIVRSSLNEPFVALRPTLAQLIPNLPRQAQVIYPKDLGTILVWAGISPGARVIEAGVGAGGLTLALLGAVGNEGRVISYEIREDFARMARENVARYHGPAENWILKVEDITDGLVEKEIDRIVLDLPEPWRVTDRAWSALRPGGVLLAYLPTVPQVKTEVDSLRDHGGFTCIQTMEGLLRFWNVRGLSVRPEHRMVAHTGFIIVARRLAAKA